MDQAGKREGLAARVARLEEGQGFAERAAERLSEEVFALGRRLEELAKKVAGLEAERRARNEHEQASGDDS